MIASHSIYRKALLFLHTRLKYTLVYILGLSLNFFVITPSFAGAGDLDLTFGNGGKISYDLEDISWDGIAGKYNVVTQSDGKIIVAGGGKGYAQNAQSENIILRFNADGSPDLSFGENGQVHIPFFAGSSVRALALQSDEKIIVGLMTATIEGNIDIGVVRLNPDGLVDDTYGINGQYVFDINNGSHDYLRGMVMLEDNQVIVAGLSNIPESNISQIFLMRINSNGNIDKAFANGGKALLNFEYGADISSLELQQNGNLLIAGMQPGAGWGYANGYLARFLENGTPDVSFGLNGKVLGEDFYFIEDIKTQTDGKIIAISTNHIYRFLADGTLDLSFGDKYRQIMDWSTKQSLGIDNLYMADIELQSNGQILLAGQFVWYVDYYLDQTSFAVLRLNPDGSLDSSYGDRGTAISEFVIDPVSNHPIISEARALVLQDEDKVLLAGMAYSVLQSSNVTDINIAMVRFDTSGDIDSEFGVSGHVVTNVKGGPTDDFVNAVTTIQGDGKIVTATASYGVHGYDFAVTRHQPDGSLDTSFNDIGWVKTDIRSERIIVEDPWYGTSMQTTISDDYPMALAVQGDGKIVVAGTSVKYVTYNEREALYVVVRYNVDGSLDSTFGDNGVVIQEGLGTQPGYYQHSPANYLADMVLQEDGKIVVTGNGWFDQTPPAPGFDFITIRYNSDGTRDASFGNDGVVITNGHTIKKNDYASSILLQPDGKILIGGSFTGYYGSPANSIAMIRYNSNGTLDSSFDTDGKVSLAMDRSLYNGWDDFSLNDIALQADGSIVVGGRLCRNDWCYFLLTKFNPDGSQDTDFGYDGYGYSLISYNANYSVIYLNQIAVQSDGRILVAGEIIHMVRTIGADQTLGRPPGFKNYTAHDMIVMRLLANGTIDYSFGELGGTVITDFADTDDAAFAITIQPDGKIIAAGTTWATTSNYFTEGHFDMAMARFEGLNTPLDELEGLVFEIQKLATQNVLNQGQAKSLSKILEAAIMQIDGDKYIAAISQLESFNKSVDTFVKTGVLSEELANKLKEVANDMLMTLS